MLRVCIRSLTHTYTQDICVHYNSDTYTQDTCNIITLTPIYTQDTCVHYKSDTYTQDTCNIITLTPVYTRDTCVHYKSDTYTQDTCHIITLHLYTHEIHACIINRTHANTRNTSVRKTLTHEHKIRECTTTLTHMCTQDACPHNNADTCIHTKYDIYIHTQDACLHNNADTCIHTKYDIYTKKACPHNNADTCIHTKYVRALCAGLTSIPDRQRNLLQMIHDELHEFSFLCGGASACVSRMAYMSMCTN
jgi:hypothetical protein